MNSSIYRFVLDLHSAVAQISIPVMVGDTSRELQISFTDALYEAVSALATVGLTTGITPVMGVPAQVLIIAFMYFGRVGVLTISLGFLMGDKAEDRFRYADTNLLIG